MAEDKLVFDSRGVREYFRNKQAGISFKAGQQSVIDWLKEHSPIFIAGQDIAAVAGNEIKELTSFYPVIRFLDWQAFLKEHGLEE